MVTRLVPSGFQDPPSLFLGPQHRRLVMILAQRDLADEDGHHEPGHEGEHADDEEAGDRGRQEDLRVG